MNPFMNSSISKNSKSSSVESIHPEVHHIWKEMHRFNAHYYDGTGEEKKEFLMSKGINTDGAESWWDFADDNENSSEAWGVLDIESNATYFCDADSPSRHHVASTSGITEAEERGLLIKERFDNDQKEVNDSQLNYENIKKATLEKSKEYYNRLPLSCRLVWDAYEILTDPKRRELRHPKDKSVVQRACLVAKIPLRGTLVDSTNV